MVRVARLRECLLRINYWGGSAQDPMQRRLDAAYQHFKGFMKANGLQCSQPPFKPWMVPWANCPSELESQDLEEDW